MHSTVRTIAIAAGAFAIGVAGSAGATKLITGRDIQNGSIQLADLSRAARRALNGEVGPSGPRGGAGPAGRAGAQGPAGAAGARASRSLETTVVTEYFVAERGRAEGEVRCPEEMVALGGSVSPIWLRVLYDHPTADGRGWTGVAIGSELGFTQTIGVSVICTPGTATVIPITGPIIPLGD